MTDPIMIMGDDGNLYPEPAEELEFKALVDVYVQRFGKEPDWWVLGSSDDRAHDIREAIRTGQPIVLNIPDGADA